MLIGPLDFRTVVALDPSNREAAQYLRFEGSQNAGRSIHFVSEPAHRRTPVEIWSNIASCIPKYHLRAWLSVSPFHRDIALTHIFRNLDLFFGEEQQENLNRGMDLFERVKSDPSFAQRIQTLRVHWAYEESDMLDLMTRTSSLPPDGQFLRSGYRDIPSRHTDIHSSSRV